MDKHLVNGHSSEPEYKDLDMRNYLPWLKLPRKTAIRQMDCDFDKDYLKFRSYPLNQNQEILFAGMSQIEDSELYQEMFKRILFHLKIQALFLWNSTLSKRFFKILSTQKSINRLELDNCHLGDLAAPLLRGIRLDTLNTLAIRSDPIGNRGFKLIMKLNLPNIQMLLLSNTNCTSDCIKLIKKWPMVKLRGFGFTLHRGFNEHICVKEVFHLSDWKAVGFFIGLNYRKLKPVFIDIGHLCKLKIHVEQKNKIVLDVDRSRLTDRDTDQQYIKKKLLNSASRVQIILKVVQLYWR